MIICGIGSRETPKEILEEMTKIGEWIRLENHFLRSGHAPGADWAFEHGAQEKAIVYLPWERFNIESISRANKIVVSDQKDYNSITNTYHPNHLHLSSTVRKLMNRNACQVLGLDLKRHSDLVICWTIDGGATGGTGQAMRIAEAYKVPIYNMYFEKYNTKEKLVAEITKDFNHS